MKSEKLFMFNFLKYFLCYDGSKAATKQGDGRKE